MEMHIQVKKVGVSANVTLPFSAGKQKRVEIANEGTIAKLKAGKIDFDILIATPEIMPKLVPFARVLGPKGLMPNPKNGTLVTDPKAIKTAPANLIALKTEKEAPLIHTVLGKVSQKDEELKANADAIIKALGGGKQIVKVHISSTMGPAVKIAI
jgi:large subunit ribosomal protein L1